MPSSFANRWTRVLPISPYSRSRFISVSINRSFSARSISARNARYWPLRPRNARQQTLVRCK
jgi:hypothetical protein